VQPALVIRTSRGSGGGAEGERGPNGASTPSLSLSRAPFLRLPSQRRAALIGRRSSEAQSRGQTRGGRLAPTGIIRAIVEGRTLYNPRLCFSVIICPSSHPAPPPATQPILFRARAFCRPHGQRLGRGGAGRSAGGAGERDDTANCVSHWTTELISDLKRRLVN
jgi:hypothetical protein